MNSVKSYESGSPQPPRLASGCVGSRGGAPGRTLMIPGATSLRNHSRWQRRASSSLAHKSFLLIMQAPRGERPPL